MMRVAPMRHGVDASAMEGSMTRVITCDKCEMNPGAVEINTRLCNFDTCYDCSKELESILKEWLGKRLHSWERIQDGTY